MALTTEIRGVDNSANNKRYTYTSDTSVVTLTPAELEVPTPIVYGRITEFTFESLSPDCDVYISEITGAATTDVETRVAVEGINLGYSTAFTGAPSFSNGNTIPSKTLFVNVVNNSATATGTWKLVLTFDR